MHRDEYDGAARFARRRTLRSDEREWYPPDDVGPYSFPHRPRIHEVQRPDDRTPRGYGRTPRSARSLDAFHHNMPQQPPAYLSRAPTDIQRGPRKYPVFEEDDEPDDVWHQHPRIRASASEFEPPQPRRPRQRLRAAPVPEPQPEPTSSDSQSSDSETESETESESESDDEDHIEVVEEEPSDDDDDDDDEDDEDDDEDEIESHYPQRHHHSRPHRHASRDVYLNSSQDQKPRLRIRRSRPPSLSDVEIEVEEYEPTIPDVASPRQILARRQNSESPKYDHQPRVAGVIESSRPPVATRRLVSGELSLPPPASQSDHRIRTIKIYDKRDAHHREGRPHRSPSAHSSRQQSSSSSRRAPSLLGSNFGDSSRQSSPERPATIRDCNVCLSEVPTSKCLRLKCGHRMCHSCLKQRFKSSLDEPQSFPPKCCKSVIDPALVESLLDRSFKKQWNRKYAELAEADVKSWHPVYCTSKHCGALIGPHNIRHDRVTGKKRAQCDICDTKVCVNCNTKWHHPKRCPSDQEGPKYLEQAHQEGFKRCYKCRTMVELKDGRSHMICRCGARFCVVCGTKWRKCGCPLFSYEGESDHPEHTVQSTPKSRRAIELDPEHSSPRSPGERRAGRGLPPVRAQPKGYEGEVMLRQLGEQREGKASRKLQYISEGEFDPMGGPGDLVAVAKGPKHYNMHDPFAHEGGAPAAPHGAADPWHGYERGPGGEYVVRGKRGRGKSIDQRLVDRFAETRQAPGSMHRMEPPPAVMGHHMGPPMMPPPPMGMPPPVAENGYPPGGRVIVEQELEYEDDRGSYFSHSSRSRAHSRRRARRRAGSGGEPKSSLLAGLSGRGTGTGMGRVDMWRKYVQPGDFDGEIASAAVAATKAASARATPSQAL